MSMRDRQNSNAMTLSQRIWQLNWSLILLICALASIGFAMLYSAGNGSYTPWAERQMIRSVGSA
jgi:rod shape determining protein RodA